MSDIPGNPEESAPPVEFWSDPGPGFSAEEAPEIPEQVPVSVEVDGWTPEKVISVLQEIQAPVFNGGLNSLLGVQKVDWHHRQARLEAVAPAISREWNKVEFLRELAGKTDRAVIMSYLLFEYGGPRVIQVAAERRQIARENAIRAAQQQPPTPEPASATAESPVPNPHIEDLQELKPRRRS